jgi:hypothetical protein
MERDPLTDPKPGDVVRPMKGRERYVEECNGGDISYWYPRADGTPGLRRVCWIGTWMGWCQQTKAVVLKRGS